MMYAGATARNMWAMKEPAADAVKTTALFSYHA
jgi:hypothetical protein